MHRTLCCNPRHHHDHHHHHHDYDHHHHHHEDGDDGHVFNNFGAPIETWLLLHIKDMMENFLLLFFSQFVPVSICCIVFVSHFVFCKMQDFLCNICLRNRACIFFCISSNLKNLYFHLYLSLQKQYIFCISTNFKNQYLYLYLYLYPQKLHIFLHII